MIGATIADEALTWIDTPTVWLGQIKGKGVDCKGLIAGVARACGRSEAASIEALANDYSRVKQSRLLDGMRRLFDQVSSAERGDILLVRIKGNPVHLGIVTSVRDGTPARMVHAYPALKKVRETPVRRDPAYIHSIWRWR